LHNTFIKGKYIDDGVNLPHEISKESKFQKQQGIVLKLNFEREDDKVNSEFLFSVLQVKTW
jgi:hypothetical protein